MAKPHPNRLSQTTLGYQLMKQRHDEISGVTSMRQRRQLPPLFLTLLLGFAARERKRQL